MVTPMAGETVHYTFSGLCQPAIVMGVSPFGVLDLMVYTPGGGIISRRAVAPAQDQRCGAMAGTPDRWHRPAPTAGVRAMVA